MGVGRVGRQDIDRLEKGSKGWCQNRQAQMVLRGYLPLQPALTPFLATQSEGRHIAPTQEHLMACRDHQTDCCLQSVTWRGPAPAQGLGSLMVTVLR